MFMSFHRNVLLFPLSVLYGFITDLRNFFYNRGFLKSEAFDIPIICVGNITVGGTGKTPHTEYIARLLSKDFIVAILSRGYKRNSVGFKLGSDISTVDELGDEPFQMLNKLPEVTVAVDKDRIHGVKRLLILKPGTDVIILDDGYQHRRLKPGFTILLVDYSRPVSKDHMLPYGNLREHKKNIRRADLIIITKSPRDLPAEQKKLLRDELLSKRSRAIFFTSLKYEMPVSVFENNKKIYPEWNSFSTSGAVVITGIARPEPLIIHLKKLFSEIKHLDYPDHHNFTDVDMQSCLSAFKELKTTLRYLITTEKDAVRLRNLSNMPVEIKDNLYFIPVSIQFHGHEKEQFDKLITDYVRENRRNDSLSSGERSDKS